MGAVTMEYRKNTVTVKRYIASCSNPFHYIMNFILMNIAMS